MHVRFCFILWFILIAKNQILICAFDIFMLLCRQIFYRYINYILPRYNLFIRCLIYCPYAQIRFEHITLSFACISWFLVYFICRFVRFTYILILFALPYELKLTLWLHSTFVHELIPIPSYFAVIHFILAFPLIHDNMQRSNVVVV